MALVVETGAGLSSANSYATADEADSYFDGMLETVWESSTLDAKNAALMKATIYIDGAYQNRFTGSRKLTTQALEWPRVGAVEYGYPLSDSIIPYRLKFATFQAALIALSGDLVPAIKESVVEIQVGPIKKVFESASSSPRYPVVERLLKSLIVNGSAGTMRIGR